MGASSSLHLQKYRAKLVFDSDRDVWILDHFASITNNYQRYAEMFYLLRLGIPLGYPTHEERMNGPFTINNPKILRISITTATPDIYEAYIREPLYLRAPCFHVYLKRGLILNLEGVRGHAGTVDTPPKASALLGPHCSSVGPLHDVAVAPPHVETPPPPSPDAPADDDRYFAHRALLSAIGAPLADVKQKDAPEVQDEDE